MLDIGCNRQQLRSAADWRWKLHIHINPLTIARGSVEGPPVVANVAGALTSAEGDAAQAAEHANATAGPAQPLAARLKKQWHLLPAARGPGHWFQGKASALVKQV
jgi:hypothetical protein